MSLSTFFGFCFLDADQVVPSGSRWVGEHSLTVVGDDSGSTISVSVQESDTLYQFCDQDYLEHVRGLLKVFEMETDDWMSPNQEMLVYLFGILVAFLLVILLGVCCWYDVIPNLRGVTEASFVRILVSVNFRLLIVCGR